MWTAYPCRWADRADYEAALAGVDMQGLDLLETGRVMTPPLVDAEGEILAAGDALPGWHVSVACRDRALPEGWPVIADPPVGMLRHDLPGVTPTLADYQAAIDAHVEGVAQARAYASGASCAGYVASTVQAWAAEASAFVAWRDAVWLMVFARLGEVRAGAPAPTVGELVAALPVIDWGDGA